MKGREINLDGTEVSIIKAIGISGDVLGATILERCPELEEAELIDTLKGLMSLGYVEGDKTAFYKAEDLSEIHFHVNSGYSKDIKEALDPRPQKPKSKRVRRE